MISVFRLERAVASLAFAAFMLAAADAPGADAVPNYYVLAMGVNKYQHPSAPDLQGCVNDAKRLVALFQAQGTRVRSRMLVDEQATRLGIHAALGSIGNEAHPGDLVVIFCSGHGSRRGGEWYFAPHDFDPSRYEQTTISSSELLIVAKQLVGRGHRVLLALDACFAGQIRHSPGWWLTFDVLEEGPFQRGGLMLLASCIPSETSSDGKENGQFTQALIEALQGKANVDGDDVVTLKEVKAYMMWRMRELDYKKAKLPGMPFPEQDFLCDTAYAIPETLVLSRAQVKRQRPGEDRSKPRSWFPPVDAPTLPPTGLWRQSWRLLKADGSPVLGMNKQPLEKVYELELKRNPDLGIKPQPGTLPPLGVYKVVGEYKARLSLSDAPGRLLQYQSGTYRINAVGSYTLLLEYGNGEDRLELESLTQDEMKIQVWPGQFSAPVASYCLKRVKE